MGDHVGGSKLSIFLEVAGYQTDDGLHGMTMWVTPQERSSGEGSNVS